jgi:hypothetical protein
MSATMMEIGRTVCIQKAPRAEQEEFIPSTNTNMSAPIKPLVQLQLHQEGKWCELKFKEDGCAWVISWIDIW